MPKISWCTDIHLDHLSDESIVKFGESLLTKSPEVILITGDISVTTNLVYHLSVLERVVQRPIYFVLGNHDFYGGNIAKVRSMMKDVSNMSQYLKYLPTTPYVALSQKTALIGHDGWYDAGFGDYKKTTFTMNDWYLIEDYVEKNSVTNRIPNFQTIIDVSKRLASDAVLHVASGIKSAAKYYKTILIATHFPPFDEVHAQSQRSDHPGTKPWYTSRVMGDMLRHAAASYPNVKFEVYAGHTHSKIDVKISNNLTCHVGGSEYSRPSLSDVLIFP